MKLSTVVLTYNQEHSVRQTLDSILSQQHPYSMEIVIADDASTDHTPHIISEYASKYPEIVKPVLRQHNLGLIRNYFDAISRCTGEYIAVCAGDDYWLPGKIATQITYMDSHPDCAFTYGNALVKNQSSHRDNDIIKGMNDNSFSEFMTANPIAAVTTCFRKAIMTKYINAVKPVEKNWLMEDFPFILWVSLYHSIDWIDQNFAVYRIQEESLSRSHNLDRQFSFQKNDYLIREFFLSQATTKPYYDKAYYNLYCSQRITNLKGNDINELPVKRLKLCLSKIPIKLKIKTLLLSDFPALFNTLAKFKR